MKLIEKLALEHAEKATHPEGDPHFRRAIKATWEAGFRKAREMAAEVCDQGDGGMSSLAEHGFGNQFRDRIRQLGEEEV